MLQGVADAAVRQERKTQPVHDGSRLAFGTFPPYYGGKRCRALARRYAPRGARQRSRRPAHGRTCHARHRPRSWDRDDRLRWDGRASEQAPGITSNAQRSRSAKRKEAETNERAKDGMHQRAPSQRYQFARSAWREFFRRSSMRCIAGRDCRQQAPRRMAAITTASCAPCGWSTSPIRSSCL
ncbi:hypothetical protein L665_00732 [Ralstonia solanacearum SD54]|nr:hypothetical protein L665_00732 [Ralstonia solanacearum SD54]